MKADAPSIPATGRVLIWLIATLLAMVVHIALVAAVEWVQTHEVVKKTPPAPPLEVFLLEPKQAPKPPQAVVKPQAVKAVTAPVVAAKPPAPIIAKVAKKSPATPSKPKRVAAPKPTPKPVVTEQAAITAPATPQQPTTTAPPQIVAVASAPITPPPPAVDVAALKQNYMRQALAMIKQQKHYPRSARRRHIEGDVLVELDVESTGQARNIQLSCPHSALKKATQTAIEEALPLQRPPQALPQPLHLRFVMQYRLDG